MPKCAVKRHTVNQPPDPTIKLIPLTHGQNAIVDACDYDRLSQSNWYADWSQSSRSYYAKTRGTKYDGKKTNIPMTNVILGEPRGQRIDHISHDTLDNRRSNLRKATAAESAMNRRTFRNNTCGYRGVFMDTNRKEPKWYGAVRITIGGQRQEHRIGYFDTPREAALAHNELAKKYHGSFAVLNVIE